MDKKLDTLTHNLIIVIIILLLFSAGCIYRISQLKHEVTDKNKQCMSLVGEQADALFEIMKKTQMCCDDLRETGSESDYCPTQFNYYKVLKAPLEMCSILGLDDETGCYFPSNGSISDYIR